MLGSSHSRPVLLSLAPLGHTRLGYLRGRRLKHPVGTGLVKVKGPATFNIQHSGVRQRDPSVLHNTIEAVEGKSGTDATERVSCEESSKSRLSWGDGAASPSIATSSNHASNCRDA